MRNIFTLYKVNKLAREYKKKTTFFEYLLLNIQTDLSRGIELREKKSCQFDKSYKTT